MQILGDAANASVLGRTITETRQQFASRDTPMFCLENSTLSTQKTKFGQLAKYCLHASTATLEASSSEEILCKSEWTITMLFPLNDRVYTKSRDLARPVKIDPNLDLP
jgi:hypothetical protein